MCMYITALRVSMTSVRCAKHISVSSSQPAGIGRQAMWREPLSPGELEWYYSKVALQAARTDTPAAKHLWETCLYHVARARRKMKTTRRTRSTPKCHDSEPSDSSSDSETELEINELVKKSLEDIEMLSGSDVSSDSDDDESDKRDTPASKSDSVSDTSNPLTESSNMFIDRGNGIGDLMINTSEKKATRTEGLNDNRQESGDKSKEDRFQLASSLDTGMGTSDNIYINVQAYTLPKKTVTISKTVTQEQQAMQKSVMTAGFEKKHVVPTYEESIRQFKKQRRIERSKHNGSGWFNMPAQEMTEEKTNDLTVLRMRNILDPKRFYKGFDTPALPKFFQRGRVIENAADFYSSRIPKKQRKATLVDELLADSEFRRKNKQKYIDIHNKKKALGKLKHKKSTKR